MRIDLSAFDSQTMSATTDGLTAARKLGLLFNKNIWRGLTLKFVCFIQNIFNLALNNIGPNFWICLVLNFAPTKRGCLIIARISFQLITYDSCKIKAECIFLPTVTMQPDQLRTHSLITVGVHHTQQNMVIGECSFQIPPYSTVDNAIIKLLSLSFTVLTGWVFYWS